jgi:hypothetical protein
MSDLRLAESILQILKFKLIDVIFNCVIVTVVMIIEVNY